MNKLVKIDEDTIRQIIAEHYGLRKDGVCLYQDYEFVLSNGDKRRRNFIYGIIDYDFKVEQTERRRVITDEQRRVLNEILKRNGIEGYEQSMRWLMGILLTGELPSVTDEEMEILLNNKGDE